MEKSYLKYDEFFKSTTKRFFELLGCEVITEYEIFKLPKKVDIVIIKKSEREFAFFDFFRDFNIISFKSEKDRATIKDFRDMFIYLHGYCNMEKEAELSNTVMVMIAPKISRKLLEKIRGDLLLYKRGVWRFKVNTFNMYLVEINEVEEYNIETEYLYIFSEYKKLKEGLLKLKEIRYPRKKMIEFLWKRYYIRYSNFEKDLPEELKMPKVYEADITDLVAPFIEKWKREGKQEGRKEGIKEGIKEGEIKAKIEIAKKMKKEGISIDIIIKVTGLTKKDLKKYKII